MDEVVAQIKPETNTLRYFQYDARGHCAFQTDTSGQIMEQYEYDAFGLPYFYDGSGNPTTVNGHPGSPWGNRILFTGREYLSDMRIYDFRHRVYHPELGRFLQPDPIQFKAGDYNLYRYCHNDPVNKNDPTGLRFVLREKDKPFFQAARDYLSKDPVIKKALDKMDESKTKYFIKLNDRHDNQNRTGLGGQNVTRWDPRHAARTTDGGSQSPALILWHELNHAHQRATNPAQMSIDAANKIPLFHNMEERRVILGPERAAAIKLGESPRNDHGVDHFYRVADPISR